MAHGAARLKGTTMDQQQHGSHSTGPLPGTSISAGTYVAELEIADGSAVQMEGRGTDTIADVRRAALAETGAVTGSPDQYVVLAASGRVLDDDDSIDQVLAAGEALNLQLIKPPRFGPAAEEAAADA